MNVLSMDVTFSHLYFPKMTLDAEYTLNLKDTFFSALLYVNTRI